MVSQEHRSSGVGSREIRGEGKHLQGEKKEERPQGGGPQSPLPWTRRWGSWSAQEKERAKEEEGWVKDEAAARVI